MDSKNSIIYRPPTESKSMVLEVSRGCSYGKCIFCQYQANKINLELVGNNELINQLLYLSTQASENTDIFLAGGNFLAFRTEYILETISLIKTYLPSIRNIRMYARSEDIIDKEISEIKALKEAGVDLLYIGIESGNDEVLKILNKATNKERILESLIRLDELGIKYGLSSILGAGGKKYTRVNAIDTARFYNQVNPDSVRLMVLTVIKNSKLEDMVENNNFEILTNTEVLEEELLFLENLAPKNRYLLSGLHNSNIVDILGYIPDHKDDMINRIRYFLDKVKDINAIKKENLQW